MKTFRLTWISGKPRCTGLWAWGENHGRAVELYRESIEATQVARCPDYVAYVALMAQTINWKRRLKTTVEYKTTSTGLRYNPPILEVLHVLLWDDCKRWVIPLWWNIPTDDTQYVCCNFNLILSLKQQINILNIMWAPCERSPWAKMSWPIWETESTSSLQTGRSRGLTNPMNSGLRIEMCCWRKWNKHCLSLERISQKTHTELP